MIVHTASGGPNGTYVYLWCPGCDGLHAVAVGGLSAGGPRWTWDGERERPTISPSILVTGGTTVCHSFVRVGRWEFLGDSTHALAGQTVDCVPIPEGVFR